MIIRGATGVMKPYIPTTSVIRNGYKFNNKLEKSAQNVFWWTQKT